MPKKAKNCDNCKYFLDQKDPSKQSCAKYVLPDGRKCTPTRQNEKTCKRLECPAECQYPYPREVYRSQVTFEGKVAKEYNKLYDGSMPNMEDLIKNNTLFKLYLDTSSHEEGKKNLNNNYRTYRKVPTLDNLKCGKLAKSSDGKVVNFPAMPTRKDLRGVILSSKGDISIYQAAIDWKKVKLTPLLQKKYAKQISNDKSILTIKKKKIPIAENGIQIEWWDKKKKSYTEEELLSLLPENIRPYVDLKFIHGPTGALLEQYFPTHTVDNMVLEEVYDWLRMKDLGIKNQVKTTTSKTDPLYPFYSVESNTSGIRYEFEQCMNNLMQTEHDDEKHIKKIKEMKHFSDLGDPENRLELDYVHAKIVKFLILDPRDFNNCINILYVTEKICKRGISTNLMKLMGNFLNMNTDDMENEEYRDNMEVVTNKLLGYVPQILKKIIDISENYEKYKCNGKVNENTLLLKEVYKNLFNKPMLMNMPDLGLEKFFKSFNQNIITKIILLAFITYVFVKVIGLFNINYNMKEGN